jgi:hypothetical protein
METVSREVIDALTDEHLDWREALDGVHDILDGPEGTETIVFHWSADHGRCYDCNLPAAFYLPYAYVRDYIPEPPQPRNLRCAVCAANAAADGESVERIVEEA